MGKMISDANGTNSFAPTALMKEEGKMLKGVLTGRREVETMYGKKPVYSLTVLDASCEFSLGKGQTVSPEEGTAVDLFAPTRLERQLTQVPIGSTVTIIHTGKKKAAKGQPAHTYSVEVH
jgi:hypothetical protein